jgi:hypothetical protein
MPLILYVGLAEFKDLILSPKSSTESILFGPQSKRSITGKLTPNASSTRICTLKLLTANFDRSTRAVTAPKIWKQVNGVRKVAKPGESFILKPYPNQQKTGRATYT